MDRLPPTDLVNAGVAVQVYGEAGRAWLNGMWRADPLADAVVRDDFPEGTATAAVREAIDHGVGAVPGAPASLRALFEFLDQEPAWLEHDRLDRAADALVRHTSVLAIVLGAASLVRGAGNTVAGKPLALTGRYVSQPAIRSVEVGEWLRHVITPGGMRRDGKGFAYTVRVRTIHAHVRHMLDRGSSWDEAAWGVPIPQPYMAFTLAEFGHIAIDAMQQLGVRFTQRELDDIYHLWRYVGHVIGMSEDLNPVDEADHVRIEELYRLTSPGPGPDDRAFVVALTERYLVPELTQVLPGPPAVRHAVATRLMHGLQRIFIGDTDADALGIPDDPVKHLLGRVGPVLSVVGAARTALGGGRRRATARAYRTRDAEMTRMRRAYGIEHDLVDTAPDGMA